jgi:hypothetical protein
MPTTGRKDSLAGGSSSTGSDRPDKACGDGEPSDPGQGKSARTPARDPHQHAMSAFAPLCLICLCRPLIASPWRDVIIRARPFLGRLPRACGDIPIKGTAMKFRSYVVASLLALGVLCVAAPALAADVHMFVRHEVADYATWKKAYDGFRATQKKMGVVAQAVYQSVDNPNDVTVTHDFHSLEQAKAFAASPELKSAMEKSGVKGAPQMWYTTKGAK